MARQGMRPSVKQQVLWLLAAVCAVACLALGLTEVSTSGNDCGSALSPKEVDSGGFTADQIIVSALESAECESAVSARRWSAGLWGLGALAFAFFAINVDPADD